MENNFNQPDFIAQQHHQQHMQQMHMQQMRMSAQESNDAKVFRNPIFAIIASIFAFVFIAMLIIIFSIIFMSPTTGFDSNTHIEAPGHPDMYLEENFVDGEFVDTL